LLLISSLPLDLISTFNVQPSSTTPIEPMKKDRNFLRRIFGTKPPKDSASPSNSNRSSIDSAPGAHDPRPGNDAGSIEPMGSGKFIGPIFAVLLTTVRPFFRRQCHLESECGHAQDSRPFRLWRVISVCRPRRNR
jgi:hypothetical protein